MIVVVTGGRDFNDAETVGAELDRLHAEEPIEMVVQGGARGADYHADGWAQANEIPCARFPARWRVEGRSAGPKRNQRMLTWVNSISSDVVVLAFPGGAGTANCILEAEKRELEVRRVVSERCSGGEK